MNRKRGTALPTTWARCGSSRSGGDSTVLGHLTLPLRYFNENRGMHVSFDGFEEEIRGDSAASSSHKGIGIELNTNRGNTPLPDAKWLRLYRSLGGEIVTLGTDAHTPGLCGLLPSGSGRRCCGPADFRRFAAFRQAEAGLARIVICFSGRKTGYNKSIPAPLPLRMG